MEPGEVEAGSSVTVHSHGPKKPVECEAPMAKRGRLYDSLRVLPNGGFQCPSCPFTAKTRKGIRGHYQVHRGNKHRKCRDCRKIFATMAALRTHKISKHGTHYPTRNAKSTTFDLAQASATSASSAVPRDHPLHRRQPAQPAPRDADPPLPCRALSSPLKENRLGFARRLSLSEAIAGVRMLIRPPGDYIMGDASAPFTAYSTNIEAFPAMGFERILCEGGSIVVPRQTGCTWLDRERAARTRSAT